MPEDTDILLKTPEKTEDRVNKILQIVMKGLELIKTNQFQEAIDLFENKDMATSVGIQFMNANTLGYQTSSLTQEQIKEIIFFTATHSHCSIDSKTKQISLTLSTPIKNYTIDGNNYQTYLLPDAILHETALIHAEEWIHAIQYMQGKNLTDAKDQDVETDVYNFFLQNGVPLPNSYVERYKEKVKHEKYMSQL